MFTDAEKFALNTAVNQLNLLSAQNVWENGISALNKPVYDRELSERAMMAVRIIWELKP